MAYERMNLADGTTFDETHVKHLEDGIEAAHEAAAGCATEEFVREKIAEAALGGEEVDLSSYAKKTELPTKTSQLTNDSGYITGYTETDPTVPAWAKQAKKPSYTAAEVGALPASTTIPSALSQMSEDETHRTVTDTEKAAWNAKGSVKTVNGTAPDDAGNVEIAAGAADIGITRVESLDTSNLVNLRDLETGPYVLYGYFSPYANSDMSMTFDNTIVIVAKKAAGSHLFVLTGLNSKINFLEILVDESAPGGHTFTRTDFNLLEMHKSMLRGVPEIELLAANWQTEKEEKYYQNFNVDAVNSNCKIYVGVDDDVIERMQDKVLTLEAKCVEDGVVKVIAIGDKPTLDFTVQLTFQEVIWL